MHFDRSSWLVPLFLILGVLLPAGCVLWFMNDAATSQAAAARRSVTEAYRNQLPLLRDRVDGYWQSRSANLAKQLGRGGAADFARVIQSGLADSILTPLYPATAPPFRPDAKPNESLAAAQAQIRGLVQGGNKEAALQAIQGHFISGPLARITDPQSRLVSADEQFLALHLLQRADRRFSPALQRLASELNDYDHVAIPSAQRLFLMDELRSLDPATNFPTLEGERLAQQYLETNSPPKDTWKLSSARFTALYRTSTMLASTRDFLAQQTPSRSVRFEMLPPTAAPVADSIEASPSLPGWRIAFTLLDTKPLDEAASARRKSYLWAGLLVVSAMSLTGVFAGNLFRRQLRLARFKTDLVAAVSHELKTPLASMRLLVDSLLDDATLDRAKTRDYLQLIAGENQRLTRLIENFLTFSRIERNRQRFDFAPIQASGVIQSAAQVMRERLQPPACHFEIDAAADLPLLRADEDALITVLLNLIDNAYKYTPSDKRISVRAHHADGEVVFEVADNGIGIALRDQKRIFRRFYRVDQRLARETSGCGLGLSIVEFIVRAHGGCVSVRSRPGAGSTFIVRLPEAAEMGKA